MRFFTRLAGAGARRKAIAAALLALGCAASQGAAQAKAGALSAEQIQKLGPLKDDPSLEGRLTPKIRAELRSDPGAAKTILTRNRLEWCDTSQQYEKRNPQAARESALAGVCVRQGPPDTPAVRNAAMPTASTPWKTIRVVFHLFANNDGSNPTSTPADVQGALAQLNMDYAPGRIRFVSTGVFTHRSTRFREPKDVDGEIDAMKRTYAQAPARQINAYIFEAKTANDRLLGRGTFAWDPAALVATGGFFCDNDAFGLGKRTATHEFGHCLGLWHPFHGTEEVPEDACGGCREVAGRGTAEGDNTGDFCSDTPPTSRNYNCGPPTDNAQTPDNEAVDKCNGKPFGATDFGNYMGYADDSCINHFSRQQYGRMHAWVSHKLKSWLVATGPNDPPTVESTTPSGRVISLAPGIGAAFSQPMNKATVQAAFRITPAARGTFVWTADSKSFTFRPAPALLSGTAYSVQILGSARSLANKPLDGNYNGRADAPAVDAVAWGFRTAGGPSNDLFARAQVLVGAKGAIAGSNEEATKERGEPAHSSAGGASVWYRWVAPTSGIATFDTSGSAFDTLLGAYEGTAVAALSKLDDNDDISSSDFDSVVSFHVDAGDVIYIAVDGVRSSRGVVSQGRLTLNWEMTPAPSNDLFARAQAISGASGSVRGDNSGAWSEPGEPSHLYKSPTSSIWYRWTAPASGLATFTTEGSAFDTLIAVYTGTAVNALSSAGGDDDSGSGTLSSASFTVSAGQSYAIAVNSGGYSGGRGAVKLNWSMTAAPSNDAWAGAQVLGAPDGKVPGTNVGASVEAGEPSHNYKRAYSVWYRFTAPANGFLAFSTEGSDFDTVLAAYTGASVASLSGIASNDDVSGGEWSTIGFQATAGTVYSIAVDSSSSSEQGSVVLNWGFSPAPANDMFAARQVLEGASGQVAGSNVGASAEPNEASPINSTAVSSVWYQWTAPASGVATWSTAGSNFDTTLGAYSPSPEGLTELDSSDDAGGLKTSVVSFDAVAGGVYILAIDSYSGAPRGSIVLGWSLAPGAAGREEPQPAKKPSIRDASFDLKRPPGRLEFSAR